MAIKKKYYQSTPREISTAKDVSTPRGYGIQRKKKMNRGD